LVLQRYRVGLVIYMNVLVAQSSVPSARDQLAQQIRAALSTDLVGVYKALGGGWQATPA
jgi:outer membrane protein TolC